MDVNLAPRPSVAGRRTGPLIVELAGTPGSGKTTLVPEVGAALARSGWRIHTPESGARPVVASTPLGELVSSLPSARLRKALLWRIYLGYRLAGAARHVLSDPRRFLRLARYQLRRPSGAMTRRRRVLFWYLRTAGAQEFFRRHGGSGEAFIFDEGYAHRVVQLFSSPVDAATGETVGSYIASAPAPDLLVRVECPASECLERVKHRGVWRRLESVPEAQLGDFITNAGRVVDLAMQGARAAGWNVVEVSNAGRQVDPSALSDIDAHIPAAASGGGGPLYRARVLRPGRLNLKLRGSLVRPTLAPDTLDAVLDDYGMTRTGPARNLAFALRSESVWVETDLGRVVVRAYRDHWEDETIRHEHSLLRHLQLVDYPATRLLARLDGETVSRAGEKRLAVFRFSEGVNLQGSILFPGDAWVEASRLLGGLLARLHRVTAGFRPQGIHHLALDPDGRGRDRLHGQLETVEQMASAPRSHPDDTWLASRAADIEQRLTRLADALTDSDLEVAVIHGDFGFHNVLLRKDGAATVHDFELARRDWRLVDIVETISPMPPVRAHQFLQGYRDEYGAEPPDWRHLGEMWEYHRLGGALRSWKSYSERGDIDRLAAARARVEEADRIAAEEVGTWL